MKNRQKFDDQWPDYVLRAIKSGPIPPRTNWRVTGPTTRGQRVCAFIERHLKLPDGKHGGQPFKLIPADECFVLAVYDNPAKTKRAYNSRARKNNKTTLISAIVLANLCGPEAVANAQVYSGAMTKEQAGIVATTAAKMVVQNPTLAERIRIIPSSKRLVSLTNGSEFKSMARDGPAAMGLNGRVIILDEVGSIDGDDGQDDFVDAMTSCTGAWDDAIIFAISTSAASDNALFSRWLDDAERSDDQQTVSHVYQADKDCDLLDESQWQYANPGLNLSRSYDDLKAQLTEAARLPSKEANARVLLLNQRVQRNNAWLAAQTWKDNAAPYDMEVFRRYGVTLGLDLSQVNDLCCACIAAKDEDGAIHAKLFSFSPQDGINERSMRDRVPYAQWVQSGHIYAPPGKTLDYDMVAEWLKIELEKNDIEVNSIQFDRWRAREFFSACDRVGFAASAVREEVGQGFLGMSPRIQAAETVLLQGRVKHGGNQPVLNLGASSAVIITDPSLNRKITKQKSSQKVDGIISFVMAVYPLVAMTEHEFSVDALVA
jgi:phage terminase large subunit-like protein